MMKFDTCAHESNWHINHPRLIHRAYQKLTSKVAGSSHARDRHGYFFQMLCIIGLSEER